LDYDEDEKALFLGSIAICTERAKEQAKEYGHSLERELSYLTVHGLCHLFGYDHMTDEDKKQMREKEEQILELVGVTR
jgi:probable rRNA maturation factor